MISRYEFFDSRSSLGPRLNAVLVLLSLFLTDATAAQQVLFDSLEPLELRIEAPFRRLISEQEGRFSARMISAGASDISRISSMCKVYATDVAMRVTTDAVQLFGGYGYMKDYPIEKYMRDAKITQIYEGTNQIQRLVIGRAMIKEFGARV